VLITPSSWGSQLAGYLLHQIGSIMGAVPKTVQQGFLSVTLYAQNTLLDFLG
jgi:hypothetical protein